MISSALKEIEEGFHALDRRLHSAQGRVNDILASGVNEKRERNDGPSDAALETLEFLEAFEKDLDAQIATLSASNANLTSFCEKSRKELTKQSGFWISLMDYARKNYETSFPPRLEESLRSITHSQASPDTQNAPSEDTLNPEEEEKTLQEEHLLDEPNPLHFGISKLGLQKMGYNFYDADSKKTEYSSSPPQKENFIQSETLNVRPPPSLIPQTSLDSSPTDESSLLIHKPVLIITPPPNNVVRPRERPQEITPGLFVRVRKSRDKKSVTPEAAAALEAMMSSSGSPPLLKEPPFPSLSSKAVEVMTSAASMESLKENRATLNDSFGPPAKPKLHTREFV